MIHVLVFFGSLLLAVGLSLITPAHKPVWLPILMTGLVGLLLGRIRSLTYDLGGLVLCYACLFSAGWIRSVSSFSKGSLPWIGQNLFLGGVLLLAVLGLVAARVRSGTLKPLAWFAGGCLLVCLVAALSGDAGGADPLFDWLRERGITGQRAEIVVIGIRKSIHLAFYGALAAAIFRFSESKPISFLFCLLHAVFDEFRQSVWATNRTGSGADVIVDLVGSGLVLAVLRRSKMS